MTTTHQSRTINRGGRALACGALIALCGLGASGCNNAGEGMLTGAGVGAVAGLIIGSTVGDPGAGAAIGAAVGGAGGAVIGDQNERNAHRPYGHYESRDRYDYDHRHRRAPRTVYYEYETHTEYRRCR